MKLLGVSKLIVTNAAGGLNKSFNVGDFMIFSDHVNLAGFAGVSGLVGKNLEEFGPRFPPASYSYDFDMRVLAAKAAYSLNLQETVREGVYCFVSGPSFETRAEARFLRDYVGADAVGMSTIPEVIVAKHAGIDVLGLSLITNKVSTGHGRSAINVARSSLGLEKEIVSHDDELILANHLEVLETSKARSVAFVSFVKKVISMFNL
jgi:purine-nucleoside phosphorylase